MDDGTMNHSVGFWAKKWAQYAYEETRTNGLSGAWEGVQKPYQDVFRYLNQQTVKAVGNPGRPIYEPDWDVLVILDACRADLVEDVADEYAFISDVGRFRSRGSNTTSWMERNFTADYADEMARTAYITGNPFSRRLDAEQFAVLDGVWEYGWDADLATIPAGPITDRAIDTWRHRDDHDAERMIVHYMQPHNPFVTQPGFGHIRRSPEAFGSGGQRESGDLWKNAGYTIPREHLWQAFRANLRHVLDSVEILIENMDAERVVISADHGNALGEFGMWGHPIDVLLPCIRNVPWVETSATDEHTHEPVLERGEESTDEQTVDNRLSALGYV